MNVNVIVRGVIVQNFPPVSGNQSQPGENNYKPTMDIAVCLIDSCQDSHLTQDKTLITLSPNMNMNIEHLSPPVSGHPQGPPPHPCGQEASYRKSALLQFAIQMMLCVETPCKHVQPCHLLGLSFPTRDHLNIGGVSQFRENQSLTGSRAWTITSANSSSNCELHSFVFVQWIF